MFLMQIRRDTVCFKNFAGLLVTFKKTSTQLFVNHSGVFILSLFWWEGESGCQLHFAFVIRFSYWSSWDFQEGFFFFFYFCLCEFFLTVLFKKKIQNFALKIFVEEFKKKEKKLLFVTS